MVAFIDPILYKQFYVISKEQSGNKAFNKWDDYNITIEKNIFDKIQQFIPINSNESKNNKGFRLSKNGMDTGIFKKTGENDGDDIMRNDIDIQNNMEGQINTMVSQNISNNKIQIIPIKRRDEEDN